MTDLKEIQKRIKDTAQDMLNLPDSVKIDEASLEVRKDVPGIKFFVNGVFVDPEKVLSGEAITEPGVDALKDIAEDEETDKGGRPRNKNEKKPKTKKIGKYSLNRDYSNTDEDLKIVRKFISIWRREGALTEDQIIALDAIGRKSAKKMTAGQREQLLNIFNDVRKRKGTTEG